MHSQGKYRLVDLKQTSINFVLFPQFVCLFLFMFFFLRELRLMDVLDNLCDKMKLYSARAGPEFPYIKGGMRLRFSQIRQYL